MLRRIKKVDRYCKNIIKRDDILKRIITYFLIAILIIFLVFFIFNLQSKDAGHQVTFCKDYQEIINSVQESLDPSDCNLIDDEICKNACLSNYAWFALDKEYCKYNINPDNIEDVSSIESCYVNIAVTTQDPSFCDDINFNLEGYGYLNYRIEDKVYTGYFLEIYNDEFLAEIEPMSYCFLNSVDRSDYKNCDDIRVSDELKDMCYLNFVVSDTSNPEYTGNLPFTCDELKSDKGIEFCEKLRLDVTKLRKKGVGTLN